MTQEMALAILAHNVTQVAPETHIRRGRLLYSPVFDGKALEQYEVLAVKQVVAKVFKELGHCG